MLQYVTLMASLPPLGQLFGTKEVSISRLKLDNRLKMLREKDALLLQQIENLVHWSYLQMEQTDAQIVASAKRFFEEVHNPILRETVESRLELHTIVAALRRRKRGDSAPLPEDSWGYGRWVGYIERHWTESTFRLEGMFPWILEANRLLNANDSVALERLLFGVVWNKLGNLEEGHHFDFEAVVIYVLRWNLVDRWCRYEGEAAVERFRIMVDSGIEKFTNVFNL